MTDDWGIQASFKFGPGSNHMLNVRGKDAAELATQLGDLTERLGAENFLGEASEALGVPSVMASAQAAITNAYPQAAPAGTGPVCQHGPMKDLAAKGYRNRWYCPAPKGQPQCPALP